MEREDGTYELLSITALSARQIVTGKLGSSLMQMMIYYAALAPCIAFTYLLRGLDLLTILVLLVGTFLASVLFSCVGLVFAGMNRTRQWQTLASVLLLVLLIAGAWSWGYTMTELVFGGDTPFDEPEFWYGTGFALTIYATAVTLLIQIAAAQNSFITDNRSTRIRITLLVQFLCFAGWMVFLWIISEFREMPLVMLCIAGIYWMLAGAIMTGEAAQLSPRARRDLPHSFFGRAFLTWFNPGSATGYVFAITSFATFALMVVVINVIATAGLPAMAHHIDDLNLFAILMCGYMAFYLGLGRLLIVALRKKFEFGLAAVFLVHLLLLVFAVMLPTFLQFWIQNFQSADYSALQTVNWGWTLIESVTGSSWMMKYVVFTVAAAGLCVFCLNLVLAAREIEATRIAAPKRVLDDDAPAKTTFDGIVVEPTSPGGP